MDEFIDKYHRYIIFLLIGLILIGFGIFLFKTGSFDQNNKVEILNSAVEPLEGQEITVEIGGAIEKPGVYKLSNTSRIEDLLITSGGLSASADREWVSKNINRASKLTDGQKIYIYSQSEVESAKKNGGSLDIKGVSTTALTGDLELININTASLSELDTLPGIGPVYGQKIIDNRSYSTLEELVSKGVIPQKTFEKIVDKIIY